MPRVICDASPLQYLHQLDLQFMGTLGLLIDAKQSGLISTVEPWLDRLQALRFRLAPHTRTAVLKLAGEQPV